LVALATVLTPTNLVGSHEEQAASKINLDTPHRRACPSRPVLVFAQASHRDAKFSRSSVPPFTLGIT